VIDNETKLAKFLPCLQSADWIALDTEADSLHSYPEKLCLVQVSIRGVDELVDPLAALDLSGFLKALETHELILHGADYDLRLLRLSYNFVPQAVFDTMLAARLVGCPVFGLTDLAEKHLGVKLEKGPQKANWAVRPLTERMEKYAHNDTRHLKSLADILRRELQEKGRLDWHRETCARLVADCSIPRLREPEMVWRVKGSDRLSRKSLGILRELWQWRDKEAIAANKPPYFILSHEVLARLADHASMDGLEELLPPHLSFRRRTGLTEAFARGLALPDDELPNYIRRLNRRFNEPEQRRFEELRQRRDRLAATLELDPTLIASRATLIDLALDWEKHQAGLMNWQRELLRP
jgi:ribonuclease D